MLPFLKLKNKVKVSIKLGGHRIMRGSGLNVTQPERDIMNISAGNLTFMNKVSL